MLSRAESVVVVVVNDVVVDAVAAVAVVGAVTIIVVAVAVDIVVAVAFIFSSISELSTASNFDLLLQFGNDTLSNASTPNKSQMSRGV